jgi:hypothetical protein
MQPTIQQKIKRASPPSPSSNLLVGTFWSLLLLLLPVASSCFARED